MNFMLALTLLLFELSLNTGHSIPKIEVVKGTDIYEIDENNATAVKLINPKPDLPTLREIIYYHVIEKPYAENQDNKHSKIEGRDLPELELDFDQTRRPFTNGHGYQFLDEDHSRKDEKDDIKRESGNKPEVPENVDSQNVSKNAPANTANEETRVTEEVADDNAKDIHETTVNVTEAVTEPEMSLDDDSVKEVKTYLSSLKKDTRDKLFDQLRKRYQKDRKSTDTISRRKRDLGLEDLPPAPVLPAINFDILPDFVRKMISTVQPDLKIEPDLLPADDIYNDISDNDDGDDTDSSEIERRIDEILATLKPFEGDEESSEREEHGEREGNEELEEHEEPLKKTKPKTYGMDLTGDHGYVWNDLWSDPGVFYHVGEQETDDVILEPKDEPDDKKPVTTEKPKPTDNDQDIFINIHKPTTQSPMHKTEKPNDIEILTPNDEPVSIDKSNDETGGKANKPNENVTPSEETIPSSKDQPDENNEENVEEPSKPADKIPSVETTPSNKDKVDEKPKHLKPDEDMTRPDDEKVKSVKDEKAKSEKFDKTGHHPSEDKKIDVFVEILKDERFWKWLAEWTSAYMEHFTKHIRKIAIEEIHKYIKAHQKDLKDVKEVPLNAEKDTAGKEPNVKEPQKPEPTVEDNNLIIDGKKIPVTHKSNLDDDKNTENQDMLKRRKDKKNHQHHALNKTEPLPGHKDKRETNLIVKAQNIYGNAAGSDKVTNIFVFYPNSESDKTYDEIHPFKNDTGGIFVFGTKQNKTKYSVVPNENRNITNTPLQEPVDLENEKSQVPLDNKVNIDEETETSTTAPKHIEEGAKLDNKSDLDKDTKDSVKTKEPTTEAPANDNNEKLESVKPAEVTTEKIRDDNPTHEREEIDKLSDKTNETTTKAPEKNNNEPQANTTETNKSKEESDNLTEKPEEVSTKPPEDNQKESVTPKDVLDKPIVTTEKSEDVTENPTDVTEKPIDVTDKQIDVSAKPTDVSEKPVDVSEKPVDVISKAPEDKEESAQSEKEESKSPIDDTENPVDVTSQVQEDVKPSDNVGSSKPTEENVKDATREID